MRWDQKNYGDPVYNIRNLIAGEDEFAIRFLYTAKDIKNGSDIKVEVIYFYHLRNEKIDEFWLLASLDFDYLEKA